MWYYIVDLDVYKGFAEWWKLEYPEKNLQVKVHTCDAKSTVGIEPKTPDARH